MPGAVPVPGAEATGRGGAVGQRIRCPPWETTDAHGSGAGLAAGRRFFRRFPLVEPRGGAVDAPAALGSAEPLEVAEHLDVAGTQRAERRRGAGGVSSRDLTARDRDGNVGPRGQRGRLCVWGGGKGVGRALGEGEGRGGWSPRGCWGRMDGIIGSNGDGVDGVVLGRRS